jgi:rubrerythrin
MKIKDIIREYNTRITDRMDTITYFQKTGDADLALAIPLLEQEKEQMEIIVSALEKQIPKSAAEKELLEIVGGYNFFIGDCPDCGYRICNDKGDKSENKTFCPGCGRAIKWD